MVLVDVEERSAILLQFHGLLTLCCFPIYVQINNPHYQFYLYQHHN